MHRKYFIGKKAGQVEWAKHGGPFYKRKFNKKLRKDGKHYSQKQGRDEY